MLRFFAVFAALSLFLYAPAVAQSPAIVTWDEMEARFEANPDTFYVVNFWATWCKPCVAELPFFDQLADHFGDQPVKVVLASMDFPEEVDTRVNAFLQRKQPRSEVVVMDEPKANDFIPRVDEDWSGAIPVTILVANAGTERHFHEGEFTWEGLLEFVQKHYLAVPAEEKSHSAIKE